MSMSPTQLSLRALRADGWTAQIVETWNPHARVRNDLFGFIDILAVKGDTTLGVQATSDSNVSARVRKIAEAEHVNAVREAGWRLEVHGWKQARMYHPWTCRIVDVS
jgi:carbonic anhydrase